MKTMKKILLMSTVFLSAISCVDIETEDSFQIELTKEEYEPNQINSDTGFTAIIPSSDSRVIYVSSSEGDDTNDCLSSSSPCQSIDAGTDKMREGYPDHLLLKRGDTWRGVELKNKLVSGRSATEPAVLAFYGDSGDRPVLEGDGSFYKDTNYFLRHFSFIGLEFYAYKLDPDHAEFTGSKDDSATFFVLGGGENLLFEDIFFNFSELLFQAYGDVDNDGVEDRGINITVRRNIITNTYAQTSSYDNSSRPSNMFVDGVDGFLMEENVFDYGGWYEHDNLTGAAANQYNHNVYITTETVGQKLIARNNIVVRGGSHGIHGRPGGLYEDNFFARCAVSLQLGYRSSAVLLPGTIAYAFNNVITEGETMARGDEACSGSGLCTTALWGLHVADSQYIDQGDVQVKNNIVTKHGPFTIATNPSINNYSIFDPNPGWYGDVLAITDGLFPEDVEYENNIAYDWGGFTAPEDVEYSDPGRTLADYSESLGHGTDFEAFMDIVKSRSLQEWDTRYEATSINAYIREGFGIQTLGTDDY